jgi:hypothetical protein
MDGTLRTLRKNADGKGRDFVMTCRHHSQISFLPYQTDNQENFLLCFREAEFFLIADRAMASDMADSMLTRKKSVEEEIFIAHHWTHTRYAK